MPFPARPVESSTQSPARTTNSGARRSVRPLLLLLLLVCIFFVSSYMSRLRDLAALDAEFAAEKVRIEQAKVQQDLLALEADRAQGEDTVDRAARRDLDLVLPGDQPYAVIQPAAISVTQPATLSATVAASPSTSLAPRSAATAIWRQWLELFR